MISIKKIERNFGTLILATLLIFSFTSCDPHKEIGIVERIEQLENENQLIVQLAELEINANDLNAYKEFLYEGIQTSVNTEPGVLTLYAMEDKNNPTKITVVEIYANQEAYEIHIASPHFKKYKNETLNMVDSLKLTRMRPIKFAAKTK